MSEFLKPCPFCGSEQYVVLVLQGVALVKQDLKQ